MPRDVLGGEGRTPPSERVALGGIGVGGMGVVFQAEHRLMERAVALKVINRALLARPEFVDYWSYKWSDLLLVNSDKLTPTPMWAYYNWIRKNVAANTPWDKFVRDLLTATGSTLDNGAGNFFMDHPSGQTPHAQAAMVLRQFRADETQLTHFFEQHPIQISGAVAL